MKPKSALRSFLALAGSSILAISTASALTYYWDGTSATWNDVANWSTDSAGTINPGALPLVTDDLIFNITGANSSQNITLDANQAAKSLTFNTTGSTNILGNSSGTTARTLTLGSGGITLASGAGSVTIGDQPATCGAVNLFLDANQSWTNSSTKFLWVNGNVDLNGKTLTLAGGPLNISGNITGGTLTLSGSASRRVLSGTNSFESNLSIQSTGSGVVGVLAITSIANSTENSSLGKNNTITLGAGAASPGRLEYIGTASSETNRTFIVNSSNASSQLYNNGSGVLTFTAASLLSTTSTSGTRNFILGGSNTGNNEIRGIISNMGTSTTVGNVTKTGIGTWVFGGDNTYTGSTTLNAGTLKLNYNTGANGTNTSKLSNTAITGTLLLNGGTLELVGGSHEETVLSTTLDSGTTFIKQTGGTSTLSMGDITFTGGAIDFSVGSIATTTTGTASTFLSHRATVAGTNFAMKNAVNTNIVAYDYAINGSTGYTGGAMTASFNYAMQTAGGLNTLSATTGATTNTLKIANTATGELAVGANTLTLGAILFAGSADYDITTSGAGKIQTSSATPLTLHNYGTGGAVLKLGALGGHLNQCGTGKTILTQNSLADRAVTVNGGTVQFSNYLQLGTNAAARIITLNNGTLLADTTGGNIALDANSGGGLRALTFTLGAGGGNLDVIGGNKLTVSGVISGADNSLIIGSTGSNGKVILSATNTYSGPTTVSAGTLYVTGALSNSAVTVQANGTIGSNGATGTLGQGLTILAGGNLDLTGATIDLNSTNILSLTGGNLTLGNLTFQDIVGWDWANASAGTYELIDGSFSIDWGSTAYLSEGTAYAFGNGKSGYFSSGSLTAVIVAIPEPDAAALIGSLGMLMLLRRRRI